MEQREQKPSLLGLCRVATEEGEANEEDDSQFAKFLDTALGSAYEVETQLLIAKNIGYLDDNENENDNENGGTYGRLLEKLKDIEKQLSGLIKTVRNN